MAVALGIDTGGTYTDCVVIDLNSKEIKSKAKALTTRHNLAEGITESIDKLSGIDFTDVKLVSLSTTLATNAIVEGQGCEVGLILIGSKPNKKLPTKNVVVVKGGHDIKGRAKEKIDKNEIIEAIKQLKPHVEAFAVSGYLSIRNPEHEVAVKEIINEETDLKVICANELSTNLGFFERTVTATLNARLLPIIADLIAAVKSTMREKAITAPLMIVKGDGSLISEELARDKPIETLLSGPAASMVGASYLTDLPDSIVADMGGTTTDIAVLREGRPSLNSEGATVGGWKTRVLAANIATVGIGGDSYVQIDKDDKIKVGPHKVLPLSRVTQVNDHLLKELKRVQDVKFDPLYAQATDILVFVKDPKQMVLTESEKELLSVLKKRPHALYFLGEILGMDANIIPWERLVEQGSIMRASLTPTDILHYKKELSMWQGEGALIGVEIQARRAGLLPDDFCNMVLEMMANCVVEELFELIPKSKVPLVAIGAPVNAYFPLIAEKFGAKLIIPNHAEVANAIGAATGNVVKSLNLVIQPSPDGGYLVYTPWGRKWFMKLDEAKDHCLVHGKRYVSLEAQAAGIGQFKIEVEEKDSYSSFNRGPYKEVEDMFVESNIKICAAGKPRWS